MDISRMEKEGSTTPSYTEDNSNDINYDDNVTFWHYFWQDHNRTLVPDDNSSLFYPGPYDTDVDHDPDDHTSAGTIAVLQPSLCWFLVGLWTLCLMLLFRRLTLP